MSHRKPICLSLVLLLAFSMPAAMCCDAAMAEGQGGADAPGDAEIELCHGMPRPTSSDPEAPSNTDGCEDHDCTCALHLLGACATRASDIKAVPAASSHLLLATLTMAPLQPQTWLPHTFFWTRPAPERFPPSLAAPSLVALSCQLTL